VIKKNIKLAPYTTLKIGGPAKYFVKAKSEKDVVKALQWAQKKQVPYFILGNGSNILVSDQGFRGLIIQLRITNYELQDNILTAGAGVSMSILTKITTKAGLTGLEFGIGVPGTAGGAIWGNAGAFGQEIGDVVNIVRVLKYGRNAINRVSVLKKNACRFSYRSSIFKHHPDWIILSAEFELKKDTVDQCQKRLKQILKDKKEHQPWGKPSAGSIFKNPPGKKAWELIKGIKMAGYQIGDAKISKKHTNFIVNNGQATAKQVIMLIEKIKQQVKKHYGIQLKEEIEYIGF